MSFTTRFQYDKKLICLPNKINRIINHLLWSILEFDLYTCSCASEFLDLIHFVFICGTLLTPPVHNNYTQTPFLSGQNPMLNTRCYTQPYAYVQPCIAWYCYGFFSSLCFGIHVMNIFFFLLFHCCFTLLYFFTLITFQADQQIQNMWLKCQKWNWIRAHVWDTMLRWYSVLLYCPRI